jgi:hypothetical protein
MRATNSLPTDKIVSYRIYKNEFDTNYINFLLDKSQRWWLTVIENAGKVLTVSTWESNISEIQSMMFKQFC